MNSETEGKSMRFKKFRGWEFDLTNDELIVKDRTKKLLPTQSRVLKLLIEKVGQDVLRDELMALWPNSVEPNNLDTAIKGIRQAFQELGLNPKEVIQTGHGKGYRLVASPAGVIDSGRPSFLNASLAGELQEANAAKREVRATLASDVTARFSVPPRTNTHQISRRQQALFLVGAISLTVFVLIFPRASPYPFLKTSVSASELETKARGLISIYAPIFPSETPMFFFGHLQIGNSIVGFNCGAGT